MAPEGRHIIAVFKTPSVLNENGICHMTKTTITTLPDPSGFSPDPLTDILRARLVRHGHLPEREVMTGIGVVQVKVP